MTSSGVTSPRLPSRFGLLMTLTRFVLFEAWQQRLLPALSLVAALLLALAGVLRGLDFGDAELTFLADFGYGLIYLLGSVAALWLPVRGSEILRNSGQLELWLTRPVRKSDVHWGQLIGYASVVMIWAALATTAVTAMLAWRALELGQHFAYFSFWLGGLLQGLRLVVIVALTLAMTSFFQTATLAGFMSVLLVAIAQLQYLAVDFWSRAESGLGKWPAGLLAAAFPNFKLFELPTTPLLSEGFSAATLGSLAGYGLVYFLLYGIFGAALFAKRRHEEGAG